MRPGLAAVGGLVDAVADGEVGADDAGAGADVDDVGIGRRHGDRADRAGACLVEDRFPIGTVVGRAPDAAVVEADVEHVRLARHAGHARARPARVGPIDRQCMAVYRSGSGPRRPNKRQKRRRGARGGAGAPPNENCDASMGGATRLLKLPWISRICALPPPRYRPSHEEAPPRPCSRVHPSQSPRARSAGRALGAAGPRTSRSLATTGASHTSTERPTPMPCSG